MKKLNVLMVLTQTPGLSWYRNVSFAKHMKGCDVSFFPEYDPEKLPNWEPFLKQNKGFEKELAKEILFKDVVVAQRCSYMIGACALLAICEHLKKPLFLEIDDNVFKVDSSNPGFYSVAPGSHGRDAFKDQLQLSDGVIVSTNVLKKVYQNKNPNISVIKNSIDFSLWKGKRKKNKKIRIVWQGASHHYDDLKMLAPVIPKILKKHKNVEFVFVGDGLPSFLQQNRVTHIPAVEIDKYPKLMMEKVRPDILLAPIHHTEFNEGKSNLRILEAGAMKVPVVASANEKLPYAKTITEGYDGLLADKPEEWVRAIEYLLDAKNRKRLGNNLYQMVKRDYNIKDEAKRYVDVLRRGVKLTSRKYTQESKTISETAPTQPKQ